MKITHILILTSSLVCNVAFGCGDDRQSFEKYVASAEHIVLAGVVSMEMEQNGYGDFIARSSVNFKPEEGLPIDISRYVIEFGTEILHVYKGDKNTPKNYYQMPCKGNLDLGNLFIIFSNKTEDGYEAITYNAYKFPEIVDYLNKSINKAQQ